MTQALHLPPNVSFRDEHPDLGDGREMILAGLEATPRRANPMWFYDKRGSELFDEITRLPEYYPTRTEVALLKRYAPEISDCCGPACTLIEPGSGSSDKVRLLLDSLRPAAYVPVDISAEFLREAASALGLEYPWLTVNAVCADFNGEWSFLDDLPQNKHVVFYPGSTLGNLEPAAARRFLRGMTEVVGTSGGVLIGVDRHKDRATLEAAYNDRDGVTAAFNLNILERFNALLDADFDATRFRHHAFYNESAHRIEMHLVSIGDQEVTAGGRRLRFADGETIHTENSYKYSDEDFSALAADAGFQVRHFWTDEDRLFGLYYLEHA